MRTSKPRAKESFIVLTFLFVYVGIVYFIVWMLGGW